MTALTARMVRGAVAFRSVAAFKLPYMCPQARRQIVSIWCSSWALHGAKAHAQRKRRRAASKV